MKNFLDVIRESRFLPFAHRGATRLAPENTIVAFKKAITLGFNIIETDLRCSLDHVLYCFHDKSLLRMTGDNRLIERLTSFEIDRLRIDGEYPIPKLTDIYDAFPNSYINIDAKSDACIEPLNLILRSTDARFRTCIGSFRQRRLSRIVKGADCAKIAYSMGTGRVLELLGSSFVKRSLKCEEACAQLPVRAYGFSLITPRRLSYYKSVGLKVHAWTINDPSEMQHLIDLGVDGLMTDDCQTLKSVLQLNRLWP